jgi:hypothetical protein
VYRRPHLAVPMVGSAGMPPAKGSPAAASFLDSCGAGGGEGGGRGSFVVGIVQHDQVCCDS